MAITQRFATENHVATELNNITLDKTLSIEDVPADAKAVGDAFNKLEKWQLLADITLEEEVSTIETEYFATPQRKIYVILDTLAAETNTNYAPIKVRTSDVYYRNVIFFYAKPVPTVNATRSIYEIEVLGDGKAMVSWGSARDIDVENGYGIDLNEKTTGYGKMILEPIDAYGGTINDEITGFEIGTYATFVAGTHLRVWGISK